MRIHLVPLLIFILLTTAVVLPWFLTPGFIFLPDYVWSPHIDLVEYRAHGTSTALPFVLVFAGLQTLVSTTLIQKLFLALILFLIPVGMYFLAMRYTTRRYAVLSSLLYLCNPWVFERLAGGHVHVLFGYAYLPFAVSLLHRFLHTPTVRHFGAWVLCYAFFPIISLHFAYIGAWLCGAFALTHLVNTHPPLARIRTLLLSSVAALVLVLVANAYWFGTFFGPSGTLSRFGQADFEAYATLADPAIGVWATTLSLYGFWNQNVILPRDVFGLWYIAPLVIVALSGIGAWVLVRKRDTLGITLVVLFVPILALAVGYGSPYMRPVIDVARAHIPLFSGLRETAKLTGIIAFSYALCAPLGLVYLTRHLSNRFRTPETLVLILIVLLSAGTMFWGMSRQILPHEYPREWYEADALLTQDPTVTRVLVLPWAAYLPLDFANGLPVANPAPGFFSVPVMVGENTDNEYLLESEKSVRNEHLFRLVHEIDQLEDQRAFLTQEGVSHIVLLKTGDWDRYEHITDSPILHTVYDSPRVGVYKVEE